jgi:hypothetical protein
MNTLFDTVMPMLIVFGAFSFMLKLILDHNTRKKLIEKGLTGADVKHLFVDRYRQGVPGSLKWGMVLVAVGAAILIGRLMPYDVADEYTVAFMFLFGGAALLAYGIIARRIGDNGNGSS